MFLLLEYENWTGKRPVSRWYRALSDADQALADSFFATAEKLDDLIPPNFKKFRELFEARWKGISRVQYRVFCDKDKAVITLLCGCTHKGRQYDPPKAYDTATRRKNEIKRGEAGAEVFCYGEMA